MPKIMITGINGFVGGHLARELKQNGCFVIGVGLGKQNPSLGGVLDTYLPCDLTNQQEVNNLPLEEMDVVISLAGLANVGDSFDQPDLYTTTNTQVLVTIATRLIGLKQTTTRIIAVSTGAVYSPTASLPFTEDTPLINTGSPYALSKVAMEKLCNNYRAQGLDCLIVRPFNHSGPGQREGFLIPDLAHQLLQTVKSKLPPVVGSLTTARDYTDVRDIVRGYRLLALAPKSSLHHSVYNICSGKAVTGQEIFALLQKQIPGTDKVTPRVDSSKLRPSDPTKIVGSYSRLQHDTGWSPQIPLDTTITDYVQWLESEKA